MSQLLGAKALILPDEEAARDPPSRDPPLADREVATLTELPEPEDEIG